MSRDDLLCDELQFQNVMGWDGVDKTGSKELDLYQEILEFNPVLV